MRWQAPELLLGKSKNHLGSDIYAFACVGYEVSPVLLQIFDLHNMLVNRFCRENSHSMSFQTRL